MADIGGEIVNESSRGGCLRAVPAGVALLVSSPFVALSRWVAKKRRGMEVRVSVERKEIDVRDGRKTVVSVTIDCPAVVDLRYSLTAAIVRCAEASAPRATVYHLVHRESGRDETIAVPLGVTVNDLAERLVLSWRRPALGGRVLLWVGLPRGRSLGECLDPAAYDPEAAGEPGRMIAGGGVEWAMTTRRRRRGSSVVYDVVLFVSGERADGVEEIWRGFRSPA